MTQTLAYGSIGGARWGKLFSDVPSATAILNRFPHHAEMIAITGKSHRRRRDHVQEDRIVGYRIRATYSC